ncbi:MAG: 4Fe-4S binding protein [Candidatus Eisenbacteria bacterium]
MSRTRRITQLGFLVVVLASVFLLRSHAERWCPFGGIEGLYAFVRTGSLPCSLHVSNLFILGGVLLSVLLLRRAFCSHACPIGAISEWTRRAAARAGLRARRVPPRLDRALSLLPFAVLTVVLYFTYRIGELVFRGFDPCYALISRHGEDITIWAYIVGAGLVAGATVVSLPFCRWLCPLAAVFHPFSRVAPLAVRREAAGCNDCGTCSAACPMEIPVHDRETVYDAHCTACLECVARCPRRERGALRWGPGGRQARAWPQPALIGLLIVCIAGAAAAAEIFPRASFIETRGTSSGSTSALDLRVSGLDCHGRATLLAALLNRDDLYAVSGYLKIEVWPAPDGGRARLTYDPALTNPDALRSAIIEPYYDAGADRWRTSPFEIEGRPLFDGTLR